MSYTYGRWLISRVSKELRKIKHQNKQPTFKMGHETKQIVLKWNTNGWETFFLNAPHSLTLMEMQIKTTLRLNLTLVRMSKINRTSDSSWWWGCRVRGTRVGVQTCIVNMEISVVVCQEAGNRFTSKCRHITFRYIPKVHNILLQTHLPNHVSWSSIYNRQNLNTD